ncbi:MAG: ArsC family reductase [Candidatus Thiodiazotropha sp.]
MSITQTIKLYGIANCDTVKKARNWLKDQGIEYEFHDYKKEGVDEARLREWSRVLGWEALLNRRGTTWRKLDDAEKSPLDEERAIRIMMAHSSIIKRPLLDDGQHLTLGFKPEEYAELFNDRS